MSVTLLDGLVLVIVLVSAALAMVRGFVREILSIASWVAAAVAAYLLYERLLPFTKQYVSNEHIALALTIAVIFFVTLIIVSIITMKISDFVIDSRIGIVDRTLGFVFGAARGLLLVVVAMLFFNWLVPPQQQPKWVVASRSKPMLDELGVRLVAALPSGPDATILEKIRPGAPTKVVPQTGPEPQAETPPAPNAVPPEGAAPGAEPAPGTTAPGATPDQTKATTPDAKYGSNARQGLNQLIQSSGSGNSQ